MLTTTAFIVVTAKFFGPLRSQIPKFHALTTMKRCFTHLELSSKAANVAIQKVGVNIDPDNLQCGKLQEKKVKSFLSEMVARQPNGFSTSGKIRAGIKTPTKATQQNPEAMKIVERVRNGEISFQAAASEITKKFDIKNPFFPRNTPFYSAHPWDMESGHVAADKLMELYGEVREGDRMPRLYRFPVVFPDIHKGGIDVVLGSGLAVRGGGPQTIRYQSRYGDDGVRRCVYLPPVVPQKDAQRKQHPRREFVVRGLCEPDICPQFASGECRFAGTLRFYIPGVSGAGVFSLETGSTLAASDIYLRLSSLLQECGSLPNFTPDGRPVFWLSKALKTRVYFDEDGKQKKGEQWVPVLETEIDLTKVKLIQEKKRMLLAAPSAAPAASGLPTTWAMSDPEEEAQEGVFPASQHPCVDEDGVVDEPVTATPQMQPQGGNEGHGAISALLAKAEGMGIAQKTREWARLRFGDDWETAKAGAALEGFAAIEGRFGQHAGSYLDLQTRLLSHDIPFQEVAMPYFKARFGGIGLGANLSSIISHVDELLEQGPAVARSYMEANAVA